MRHGMGARATARRGTAVLAAAIAAALAAGAPSALAAGEDCAPACVVLVEVAGLEPEDVTPTGTPFLWALAHPNEQGSDALLQDRNGFMWQAARSPMTASTATSAASLL